MDEFLEKHGVMTHHAWGMTETSPLGSFYAPKPGHDVLPADVQRLGKGARETCEHDQLRLVRHAFELRLREEPIESAGDGFLDALDQPVEGSASARIHCTNGSNFSFGGIARVQQRHQVG